MTLLIYSCNDKVEKQKPKQISESIIKSEAYNTTLNLIVPWASDDASYFIIEKRDENILSVLDLSITKTTKAMSIL